MVEGTYRNGLQDGEWTLWYENGTRASVDHYVNGLQNGLHTSWYANGQKALEGEYRGGKRHGVWTQWDPNGLTSHRMVYRQGKAAEVAQHSYKSTHFAEHSLRSQINRYARAAFSAQYTSARVWCHTFDHPAQFAQIITRMIRMRIIAGPEKAVLTDQACHRGHRALIRIGRNVTLAPEVK